MKPGLLLSLLLLSFLPCRVTAQDISLYEQFNGRYDFVFFGNTMNPDENSFMTTPQVLTSTAADFQLGPGDQVEAAYLYWAGCGTGDFQVQLNGNPITAERTFAHQWISNGMLFEYFSAFADVTQQLQSTGNGTYTLSDLDVSDYVPYAYLNRTNFAGWAIIVVYKNNALPINQINVYDGMQAVPEQITINLESLNVIDNVGAKIGFLAWEGDKNIAEGEMLSINNATLSNALNPATNAFNGTNTFTGSTSLYNMDLDVYDIQGNINIGDTSAEIHLTSNQDVVMVNAVVTKLNSQLPDATIVADAVTTFCQSREVEIAYTVSNFNSTDVLPAGTPIAFYADGVLIGSAATVSALAVDASESGTLILTLPDVIPDAFALTLAVDDNGSGAGTVTELLENNNTFATAAALIPPPQFNPVPDLFSCNEGLTAGSFDFYGYAQQIAAAPNQTVTFYESLEDAQDAQNEILDSSDFHANATPKTIYFRVHDDICYDIGSFVLRVRNCPPTIYNFVSSNGDGINDSFHIDGLRDIFVNFRLSVFNRWGALVWMGDNNSEEWDGVATKGIRWSDGNVPDGTYYYVLDLNDPDYPQPFTGFLYLVQ